MRNNSKLPNIETSIFSIMGKMAKEHNAINLAQGFPNFPGDKALNALVERAMQDGYNQYAPMAGDFNLRMEISKKIEDLHDHFYDPESEITITAGATQAIFSIIAATIDRGDEVIVFTPAYDCYIPSIEIFGGKVVPIQLKPFSYKIDWQEVKDNIIAKTRMILINSPHNPTGTLLSKEDMLALQDIAENNDLLVLSDEVYEHIVYDGEEHQSASRFPQLAARSFITASFGKTFHNTGWKLGYCAAPKSLMEQFQKVHQFNVFCVNHPMQKALATYLKNPDNYLKLSNFYQQKRDFFQHLMQESNFKIMPCKGTYFQMLDFSAISEQSDLAFTKKLTKDYKIATIPTSVFNVGKEDFKQIRICFAKTEETLVKAAKILKTIS